MKPAAPARIHLLPARKSPYVVVLRRKPSQCFHVVRWNTDTDELEYGSWFTGKLYPLRCDVSFDGQWMVYLALGASGETWNGVCRLPFLKTVAEGSNLGTWYGGGYWKDRKTLCLNHWRPDSGSVPFSIRAYDSEFGGEDFGVFFPRLKRDGWVRRGDHFGVEQRIRPASKYMVKCIGDDGWENRPSNRHPTMVAKYIGYLQHGYTFRFELNKYPSLLDENVQSACWDSLGNLICARQGVLYKYSLEDLQTGNPGTVKDLEPLSRNQSS